MKNRLSSVSVLATLLAGAFIAAGCSSSSSSGGPIISAANATATDNGNGTFDLTFSVTFDDSIDVDSYTIDCTDNADASNDIHEAGSLVPALMSGTATIPEQNVSATPFDYMCTVQLIDGAGDSSGLFDFTFNLS